MKKYNIVGVGTPSVDTLNTENGIIKRFGGGPIISTSVALSNWGMKTGVIGRVGEDRYGDWLLKSFDERRVDTTLISKDKNSTSIWNVISYDDKEILEPEEYTPLKKLDKNQEEAIKNSDIVLIRLNNPLFNKVAEIAKESGTKLFITFHLFDFGVKNHNFMKKYQPSVVFMVKEDYEKAVKNASIFSSDALFVIMKKEQGCSIMYKGHITSYQGYKSQKIDPTGTNDSFVAGFIYGYLKRWPVNKVARFANTLAAMATTEFGGIRKLPTKKEMKNIVSFAESMKD
jgi:sugar/nucleoside kinase (ribokinase family)